ncbi:MAG: NfeD family protein [Eubacteriales bacterium]|nr:NfeD family protein [Eubacteriales bacterium]MDD4540786.1 NfeD family protein [Eubacteriales bacterium]
MLSSLLNITILGINDWVFWLLIAVVASVIEISTLNLVSIWFIAAAIIAVVASLLGASLALQLVIFFSAAVIGLLIFIFVIRPKYMKNGGRTVATNADRIIGQVGIVTETVDTEVGRGLIRVGNQIWSARAEDEEDVIEPGAEVLIVTIRGVKAVVRRHQRKTRGEQAELDHEESNH